MTPEESPQDESPEDEEKQYGKYGKAGHFNLVKRSLIHAVNRYWERAHLIQVEKETIQLGARMRVRSGIYDDYSKGVYEVHPDLCLIVLGAKDEEKRGYGNSEMSSIIIVECETTATNMLKNEMRLLAYQMLRLRYPDRGKIKMYIALPLELKGKVKKPEAFNDLWFFDMNSPVVIPVEQESGE